MNQDTKHIRISEYNYPLPDERIAKFPLPVRDESKLLLYRKGEVSEDHFYNLPNYLPKGALMVFNNTKVIQARLHFRKETGALIEVFCLEPIEPNDYVLSFQTTGRCSWLCLVGNLKKWKEGSLRRSFEVKGRIVTLTATRGEMVGTSHWITFEWDDEELTFADLLEVVGELPIPPYLNRDTQESDKETYQTVYSKIKGSVAAPTAGLHFTPRVLAAIDEAGIDREELTLHVGAGTFKPVSTPTIGEHEMHVEKIEISRSNIECILNHLGHTVIPVGTTTVRTIESVYWFGVKLSRNSKLDAMHVMQWDPYELESLSVSTEHAYKNVLQWMEEQGIEQLEGDTQLMIAPGYRYHVISGLITNFHQPKSTLLLLVSALVGDAWKKCYRYALDHQFRFLSYGDSCLFLP